MDTTLTDALVGREVDGRYHVRSRIARGGMATVYLALDRRLERDVALKVMHADLAADPDFVSRFVREARAAARLTSPHVVQVFDQGTDGDVLYLAMEYLPGRTLRDVLSERGGLTPREALSVMEPVLEALGAAHRAGIVHRDVKPENVILTDDGRIKVADFGLARAITAPITGQGPDARLLGTVAYLAPELVSRGIADARADVYAAGIILFEALTGRQPFTGGDPVHVAHRHVTEAVPAPSSVVPGLPAELDELVLMATRHDPDGRPGDGDRLLAEVREVQRRLTDTQLDLRAVAPPGAADATQVVAQPAGHQETRALVMPRRGAGQLVPRLRVNDDDDHDEGWAQRDRRRQWTIVGAALAAVVILLGGGIWWFASGPGAYTSTPGLVGARSEEAQRALTAQGLRGEEREVFDGRVPRGQIVSTDPAAGDDVRKNGTVVLFVSKGPEQVAVPDLARKTPEEASGELEALGLKAGKTSGKFHDSIADGQIISTSPKSGTTLTPGRPVDLVVSKGPKPIDMPQVTGKNRRQVQKQLGDLGLNVQWSEIGYQFPFGPLPGTITAQDPAEGTELVKGDTVTLTVVALQPGQQAAVQVPNVTGWSYADAERELRGKGFGVKRERQGLGEQVTGQNPPGDSPAAPGSEITLWTQ